MAPLRGRDSYLHRLSAAWLPGADWSRLAFAPLAGRGPLRFVAPYPASLLKLMVAVGVGLAVDAGCCAWQAELVEPMIVASSNEATDALVALLHRTDGIARLHAACARCALPTLRLEDTTPAGGWRNAQGAGVGHIHMTAWDTVRLLWLLDAEAPHAPWLAPDAPPLLRPATRARLRALLERQQLDGILSSASLADLPGWRPGIPPEARFAQDRLHRQLRGRRRHRAPGAGALHRGVAHHVGPALCAASALLRPLGAAGAGCGGARRRAEPAVTPCGALQRACGAAVPVPPLPVPPGAGPDERAGAPRHGRTRAALRCAAPGARA
ncbi:MAG: hypothetical protein U1F07_04600 [Rubrivivax sp.]